MLQQVQHIIFDPGLLHLPIRDAIDADSADADLLPGGWNTHQFALLCPAKGIASDNLVVTAVEERGYVERVPDPRDGRAKIVRLTERGRQAAQAGNEIIEGIERAWAAALGPEDMDELRALLECLVSILRWQQGR